MIRRSYILFAILILSFLTLLIIWVTTLQPEGQYPPIPAEWRCEQIGINSCVEINSLRPSWERKFYDRNTGTRVSCYEVWKCNSCEECFLLFNSREAAWARERLKERNNNSYWYTASAEAPNNGLWLCGLSSSMSMLLILNSISSCRLSKDSASSFHLSIHTSGKVKEVY